MRRAGETKAATGGRLIAWLAVLHTPIVAEQALPFVVLIGAMAAFLNLSRRLELRWRARRGVSVWQFLAPAAGRRAAVRRRRGGGLQSAVDRDEAAGRGAGGQAVRLAGARTPAASGCARRPCDGQSIVHVDGRDLDKDVFLGVEAYNFGADGAFDQRVDAKTAVLRDGYWELHDAEVVAPGDDESHADMYLLATTLTRDQVAQSFVPPDTVSFFGLAALAAQVKSAGLDATPYRAAARAIARAAASRSPP